MIPPLANVFTLCVFWVDIIVVREEALERSHIGDLHFVTVEYWED
jgi:hypothetical protein